MAGYIPWCVHSYGTVLRCAVCASPARLCTRCARWQEEEASSAAACDPMDWVADSASDWGSARRFQSLVLSVRFQSVCFAERVRKPFAFCALVSRAGARVGTPKRERAKLLNRTLAKLCSDAIECIRLCTICHSKL